MRKCNIRYSADPDVIGDLPFVGGMVEMAEITERRERIKRAVTGSRMPR
jgi:hypothetical protein